MGGYTKTLESVPEFTGPARTERFASSNGMEIVAIAPLDGSPVVYQSSINLQTTQGTINLVFTITEVDSIEAACAKWQLSAREAIQVAAQRMKEQQRRIVLPGNPAANSLPFKELN